MAGTSPVLAKRQLGVALRKLREGRGVDREAAAGALECSLSKISRIESGDVGVKAVELRTLLDLYQVEARQRNDLERLGQQTRQRAAAGSRVMMPDWFRRYVSLEDAATELYVFEEALVYGAFQTRDYARSVLESAPLLEPDHIEQSVATRMARKARLTEERPLYVHVILWEPVLLTQVGGPEVMHEQIAHLRDLAGRDNIVFQVLPLEAGAHAALGFPFYLLKLPNSDGRPLVYLESLTGARYIESSPAEQRSYELVWHYLTRTALSPVASIEHLDSLLADRGAR